MFNYDGVSKGSYPISEESGRGVRLDVISINPTTRSENIDNIIDRGSDVMLLVAYASGTLPQILLPQIQRATDMGIPVFTIRDNMDTKWTTEWSDYKEEILPGLYMTEALAIKAGVVPLRLNKRDLIMGAIEDIRILCEESSGYDSTVETVLGAFSTPEWRKRLQHFRKDYRPRRDWEAEPNGECSGLKRD